MPNLFVAKQSFGGGEYAPSLQNRSDLELHGSGAKKLQNFFVHAHGGASNRAGTHMIAAAKYDDEEIILVSFEFSTTQTYIIEFGKLYCRFYTDGGQILDPVDPVEIVTPYTEADLTDLTLYYTQSADVLYLAHPNHEPRELARTSDTVWTLNEYDFQLGPFQTINLDTAKTVAISAVSGDDKTLTADGFTFEDTAAATHVGSLWKLRHYIEGQAVTQAFASSTQSTSISSGGTWRLITHGTWTGTLEIEKSTDGGSTWTRLRLFSSADDFNPETFGVEALIDDAPYLVRMNMSSHSSGTCNADLSTDAYFQEGVAKITAVAEGGVTATADVKKNFGLTSATIDFSEGSWSDFRGWPSVVEFHPDDRLVWANCTNEPQTYWMTKTGNYINFGRSSPLVDSDGISSPLPARKINGINGLVPLAELVALTAQSNASIQSSSGPITPTTIYNRIFDYEGSFGTKPVVVGNRVIYVQATGSIIRDLEYVRGNVAGSNSGFAGDDISFKSNHFFTGFTITEMAYAQNPDRLVWAIRSDGALLSLTYLQEQEVVAWTKHDTNKSNAPAWVTETAYVAGNWVTEDGVDYKCPSGKSHTSGTFATDLAAGKWVATERTASFESVATIRGDGYDEVWFSVNREGQRYIERLDNRMASTEAEDQFFVDCGLTYDDDATDTITGLDHLEGKAVSVLADGNVVPNMVVLDGEIVMPEEYSLVHVGIGYDCDLQTLDIDIIMADGSLRGRKIKVSQCLFAYLNSRGGMIGPDFDNMFDVVNEGRDTWDDPLELFSGDQQDTIDGHYDDGGNVCYRQSDPLPVTILGLVPNIQTGDRMVQ